MKHLQSLTSAGGERTIRSKLAVRAASSFLESQGVLLQCASTAMPNGPCLLVCSDNLPWLK